MQEPVTKPAISAGTIWSELRAILDLVLDFSFKRFVTPRLIRVLYALSLLAATLAALTWMGSGFTHSVLYGFFTLVTGPLAFILYVLTARVMMEIILAIFQIAEHAQRSSGGRDSELR
jgi:uncharacterized membrane protein